MQHQPSFSLVNPEISPPPSFITHYPGSSLRLPKTPHYSHIPGGPAPPSHCPLEPVVPCLHLFHVSLSFSPLSELSPKMNENEFGCHTAILMNRGKQLHLALEELLDSGHLGISRWSRRTAKSCVCLALFLLHSVRRSQSPISPSFLPFSFVLNIPHLIPTRWVT